MNRTLKYLTSILLICILLLTATGCKLFKRKDPVPNEPAQSETQDTTHNETQIETETDDKEKDSQPKDVDSMEIQDEENIELDDGAGTGGM